MGVDESVVSVIHSCGGWEMQLLHSSCVDSRFPVFHLADLMEASKFRGVQNINTLPTA